MRLSGIFLSVSLTLELQEPATCLALPVGCGAPDSAPQAFQASTLENEPLYVLFFFFDASR